MSEQEEGLSSMPLSAVGDQTDRTSRRQNPLSEKDVRYEELYPLLNLKEKEKAVYMFFYELYLYYEDETVDDVASPSESVYAKWKRRLFTWKNRGIVSSICYVLLFAQWLSVFLDYKLPWGESNAKIFRYFSVITNFQISLLWGDSSFVLTVVLPFLFSSLFTLLLLSLTIVCFVIHWKYFKQLQSSLSIDQYENFEEHPQIMLFNVRKSNSKRRILFRILFNMIEILPALFIPISISFLNSIVSLNVFVMLPSLLFILPFTIISIIYLTTIYEWRFETGNMAAKSHSRLDLAIFISCTISVWAHVFFQDTILLSTVMMLDFTLFLVILSCNIFFVPWFKTAMNIIFSILVFSCLFVLTMTSMLAVMKLLIPGMDYNNSDYAELTVYGCIFFSMIAGYLFTKFRLTFNEMVVNEETRTRYLLHSQRNAIIIPRLAFEVEMSIRTIQFVSNFVGKFLD